MYDPPVTLTTLDAEPACPGSDGSPSRADAGPPASSGRTMAADAVAIRRSFDAISQARWDDLARRTPWATPFARWAFHRAWWDAYGASAHDQTVVVVDPARPDATPIAIVPLMHRHEVEPSDSAIAHDRCARDGAPLTPVEPTAKAVFFGASYHADYATVLCAPADLPAVARAVVDLLGREAGDDERPPKPWDDVDLRRLRCGDPGRGRAGGRAPARRATRRGLAVVRRAGGRLPGGHPRPRRPTSRTTSARSARRSATRSGARSGGPKPPARSA